MTTKSMFLNSNKTPWNNGKDIRVWLVVGVIMAIIGHNITKGVNKI